MSGTSSQLYDTSSDSFPSLSQAITRSQNSSFFSTNSSLRPAPPSHPPPSSVPGSASSTAASSLHSTLVAAVVPAVAAAGGYAGWLNKVGGKIQSWKRRYCYIRDHQLCYAKQPTSAILHSLPLRGATVHLYQEANIHGNRRHLWGVAAVMDVFLPVQSATSSERLYLFQCDSDADRDSWIQACLECQAMLFSPLSQPGDAVMQGWLQGTKKGYFILTATALSFFRTAPTSSSVTADKLWKLTSSSRVELPASQAFSVTFTSSGHKAIELMATDGVERGHWYRAIVGAIEQLRGGESQSSTPAIGTHSRSISIQPVWNGGERGSNAESIRVMDEDDSDGSDSEQLIRVVSAAKYEYADSDEEDFSPRAPMLQKESGHGEEEKRPISPHRYLPPPSRKPAAPPVAVAHASLPMQPSPPAGPPPASADDNESSSLGEDEDEDDGCYDPLFHSLAKQLPLDGNDVPSGNNPLCSTAPKRTLRAHRPVVNTRNRQGSPAMLLSPPESSVVPSSPVSNASNSSLSPRTPLSPAVSARISPLPPPSVTILPSTLSTALSALPASHPSIAASPLQLAQLAASQSILSTSLHSLLSVAFRGDFEAFRSSVLSYVEQAGQQMSNAAVTATSSTSTFLSAAAALPSAASSILTPPSQSRRSKPPAILTSNAYTADAVEFHYNPLAASSALSANSSTQAANGESMPTSPTAASVPSSPRVPTSQRHPRLIHVHVLEAVDLPALSSAAASSPSATLDVRVELQSRGRLQREDGHSEDEGKAKVQKGKKRKTKTCSGSRYPLWDEMLTLNCEEWADELMCDVVQPGSALTADVSLGRVVISVDELEMHEGGMNGWWPICHRSSGLPTQGLLYLSLRLDDNFSKEAERAAGPYTEYRRSLLPSPPLDPLTFPTRLFFATWNLGNAAPPSDLSPLLPLGLADIYIVNTQECQYSPRQDLKSCKTDWMCCLLSHFGSQYTLVKYWCLWEMRLAVFVRAGLVKAVSGVAAQTVATGIGNMLGNKGGVCISLTLHHTQLCFVNCHLAAHQENTPLRNANCRSIFKSLKVSGSGGADDVTNAYHHVFLSGDLNYRLEYGCQGDNRSPSTEQFNEMSSMIDAIIEGNKSLLPDLLVTDQLRLEMQSGRVMPVSLGWREDEQRFPPTFKVLRKAGTRYVSSRSPAWCDRVVWKELAGYRVTPLLLDSVPSMHTSDHKPVIAMMEVDTFLLPAPLDPTRGACQLAVLSLTVEELPTGRWYDTFVIIESPLLSSPLITSTHKKNAVPPAWLDLPTRQLQYNNLNRITHTLLSVRAINHSATDPLLGRASISLRPLGQYSQHQSARRHHNRATDGSMSLPVGAAVEASGNVGGGGRSAWIDHEFSVGLSVTGVETCRVKGQLRFMWSSSGRERDDSLGNVYDAITASVSK